jgi:osmotically-inducible protein OsmY
VTAGVKAELIKDPDLRALRIDVDTHNGKVLLTGHAPSASARDRATHLAYAVKGVASVDNRLQVNG